MKMNLKNNEEKVKIFKKINIKSIKKYLTYKNLMLFLGSLLLIGMVVGISFYMYMNSNDKALVNNNISSYFLVKDSYNYLDVLKSSIINNIGNISIIWLLGISVIGIVIVIFLFFAESFSIGFCLASIISNYGFKGIMGVISYLFPTRILYLLMLYILTYFAIRFSVQIIRYLFFKKDVDLRAFLKKYFKILLIVIVIGIVCSLLETFIDPLMIKLFTFFLK